MNQFIVAMTSSEFAETSSVTAAFSSVEDEMPSRLVIYLPLNLFNLDACILDLCHAVGQPLIALSDF